MDLNAVRLEIKEDLHEINDRIKSLEQHTIQYQILFTEHSKQDAKMYEAIDDFREKQSIMVGQLGEYNS